MARSIYLSFRSPQKLDGS
ncbi:BnaC02g06790D [Brassica napus]|uniref:BnaC02g06790D protein n=1 Tax=Brassica napus TaxID=3708 RepID=A0A078HLA4_BRANA|nr:BnaC02g06790D [Brassica napus]